MPWRYSTGAPAGVADVVDRRVRPCGGHGGGGGGWGSAAAEPTLAARRYRLPASPKPEVPLPCNPSVRPGRAPPAPQRPAAGPPPPVPRLAVVAVAAYVGAQVIADITSVKIGSPSAGRSTWAPSSTRSRSPARRRPQDRRQAAARTLVVTAAVVNLFMALYLQWVARARATPGYPLGDEFKAVLGPLWRIVVASIVAEVISELLDTEVYHWFVRRVTTRYQWARVAVSHAVSIPVDNAFAVLAFGALPFLSDDHPSPCRGPRCGTSSSSTWRSRRWCRRSACR